jgi:hypothetical protein
MEKIKVEVLKRFPISDDGFSVRHATPGPDTINAELFAGLEAAGYVAAAGKAPVVPTTQPEPTDLGSLPENWRDMHHNALIKVAKMLDETVSTKADAVAAIELALEQNKQD